MARAVADGRRQKRHDPKSPEIASAKHGDAKL
jgi:hypothetical protein